MNYLARNIINTGNPASAEMYNTTHANKIGLRYATEIMSFRIISPDFSFNTTNLFINPRFITP
jgi:hypothetical protein